MDGDVKAYTDHTNEMGEGGGKHRLSAQEKKNEFFWYKSVVQDRRQYGIFISNLSIYTNYGFL